MSRKPHEYWDETWNPVRGCTPASAGCDHCFAARVAARFWAHLVDDDSRRFSGAVEYRPEQLSKPRRWRKPRVVLTPTMADLFHARVHPTDRARVARTIGECRDHTFITLTKRTRNLALYAQRTAIPPNWILGPSVESWDVAERLYALHSLPVGQRVISFEPLLGPIPLDPVPGSLNADWIIAGAETGPGARPCDPDWLRALRDYCIASSVPFFLKQVDSKRDRELDGRTWDEVLP